MQCEGRRGGHEHTVELVPLLVGLVLEDIALLLQAFADEGVELAEEALELWVVVGVAVDLVDRLE